MKKLQLFLLGLVACCMTAAAQSGFPLIPDSMRINSSEVAGKIGDFINVRTPELKAYFRSLRPVEKVYWEYICIYDSILTAWKDMPEKIRQREEVEPYLVSIQSEYGMLSYGAMLSYTDEILANPTIQRLIEEARESIRNGASSSAALCALLDKLDKLPRYRDCWKEGPFSRQQRRLLAENSALHNALNALTARDFDSLFLEREGWANVRDTTTCVIKVHKTPKRRH